MKCPYCDGNNFKVVDSRPILKKNGTRRRKLCIGCGDRFTTYEIIRPIKIKAGNLLN